MSINPLLIHLMEQSTADIVNHVITDKTLSQRVKLVADVILRTGDKPLSDILMFGMAEANLHAFKYYEDMKNLEGDSDA